MKLDKSAAAPATASGINSTVQGKASSAPKEAAGDTANRIANITQSGAKPARVVTGKGNPNLDKDAFFKLMLTQVQNQDPTSPLKSHEMSAQLAQFSSLEQMSNIHSVLDDMKKAQGHDSQYQALDMIGKVVSGDNSKIDRMTGDAKHDISFNLGDSAVELKVAISDAQGKIVKVFDMANQAKGNVTVAWDGKDNDGNLMPPGAYKMNAEGKNLQGHKISVDPTFKGAVTGVQFTERGPVVMIDKKSVPFKDIKQIEVEKPAAAVTGMMPGMPNMPGPISAKPAGLDLAVGAKDVMPSMQLPLNLNNKI